MRRLIIIGGSAPERIGIDEKMYSAIIAADSGYDTAKRLGIPVTDAVGDFDSTSLRHELEAMGYEACSRDKADSDAVLAIKRGSGEYELIGGGEGRLDHTLSLLSAFRVHGAPRVWYMAIDTVIAIDGKAEFSLPAGMECSFFTIAGSARVITSGLFWELGDYEMLSDRFISLSNRTASEKLAIETDREIMMRVRTEDFPLIRRLDA